MTNKESMLKKLSASEFALWEMHLYLDTHPWDIQMVENYNRAYPACEALKNEFEEKYYRLSSDRAQGVEWLRAPWPWDVEECEF